MHTYVLILMVAMNRAGAMTAIPGYSTLSECESAGVQAIISFKHGSPAGTGREYTPRWYCVWGPEKSSDH